jgi:retinol dehydrogenase-12
MREMTALSKVMYFAMNARTTEQGSRTLVHAATAAGPESHGQYLSDCKVMEPSEFVRSAEGKKAGERVWEELSEKLEKIEPGVLKNL